MASGTDLPEFIACGSDPVTIGRAPQCDVRLPDLAVALTHATLQRRNDSLWIIDHDARYGTYVNRRRVTESALSIDDIVRFGTSIAYRVEWNGLRFDERPDGISLTAHGIGLVKADCLLVHDASFSISSNSFVGIVGPSGCGKSTVLQSLAGYLRPAQGWLEADGQDIYANPEGHRQAIGYVAQDDIIFPSLTIRENLTFAAELRFGASNQGGDVDRVVDVIESIGLTDVADNIQYSGGQRKRLSVAVELLKRPRLLLLDEPTSGLDYASEANLMAQLHKLTEQGTTVICTTHHLANLELFDRVIVLGIQDSPESAEQPSKPKTWNLHELMETLDKVLPGRPLPRRADSRAKVGRIVYAGPPRETFKTLDCHSFARLFERLNSGRFKPARSPAIVQAPGASCESANKNENLAFELTDASFDQLKQATWQAVQDASAELSQLACDTSLWRQVTLLLKRFVLVLRRDRGLVLTMIGQPLALALLVVFSQFRVSASAAVGFFLVVLAVWFGMNNSVRELIRARKTYVREQMAGLSPVAFYLSCVLGHAAIGIVQVLLLLLVTGIFGALVFSEDTRQQLNISVRFLYLWPVLALCHFGGVGIGLLISAAARTEETAVATLPLVIMPQLVLSAMATGQVDVSYSSSRPFRPLVNAFTNPHESGAAALVDFLSMACLSRPGTLLIESPQGWRWMGDLCHLAILLAAIWATAYLLFLREQMRWPKYIGLG